MSPAEALREAMETATSKLPAGRGAAKKVLRPKKNAAAVKRSPKEHGGAAGIANETEETRHLGKLKFQTYTEKSYITYQIKAPMGPLNVGWGTSE